MVRTKSVLYYSLLSALVMMPSDSYSAIRIGNKSRSYAAAYSQVEAMRNPAPTVASAHGDDLGIAGQTEEGTSTVDLPIHVADPILADDVASGNSTTVTFAQLENCGSVYPNGDFAWDTPTAGSNTGGGSQCVAVVEMRGYQMGPNGSDAVVARVNVAAGDTVKCNISAWPESSYLPAAGTIEFPADAEPTPEDVVAVMNQEQKQHAGIKIAAGTLIAAVAGNALGASEGGKNSMFGANKEKLKSTAIGGLAGAAIMTGNVYGGKVAGDMILSAGINAAAGGLIGNMAASGDEVLKIEPCSYSATTTEETTKPAAKKESSKEETTKPAAKKESSKCLWAEYIQTKNLETDKYEYFYDIAEEESYVCEKVTTGNETELKNCKEIELINVVPENYSGNDANNEPYTIAKIASENYSKITTSYRMENKDMVSVTGMPKPTADNKFVRIETAGIPQSTTHILIVGVSDKAFGWKQKNWNEFQKAYKDKDIRGRGDDGQPYELPADIDNAITSAGGISAIIPVYKGADDGPLIDLGNKARLKGTIIGAGAGGALGAFTAYQGAQTEIQERWTTAVREYKDSLQKVYCATGSRFLSQYNGLVEIPNAKSE